MSECHGSRRELPDGVRRALTFWRRSIQARVVASTLAAVGGRRQRGRLVPAAADPGRPARAAGRRGRRGGRGEVREAEVRLDAASGMDADATRQQRDLVDPIIAARPDPRLRRGARGPQRPGARHRRDGGAVCTSGLDTASVPELDGAALRRGRRRHAPGPTPRSSPTEDGRTDRAPGIVVGSQVRLPADGQTYTLYFLFPLDEQEETLALVTRALLTAAACCWCWSPGSPGW